MSKDGAVRAIENIINADHINDDEDFIAATFNAQNGEPVNIDNRPQHEDHDWIDIAKYSDPDEQPIYAYQFYGILQDRHYCQDEYEGNYASIDEAKQAALELYNSDSINVDVEENEFDAGIRHIGQTITRWKYLDKSIYDMRTELEFAEPLLERLIARFGYKPAPTTLTLNKQEK